MEDIENIVKNENLIKFAKDLFKCEFNSNEDYIKNYDIRKKKYKMCPNKPTLNKLYFKLLKNGEIKENTSFLKYSLKKKVRSSSGVSVITILTSPNPSYLDENGETVIQEFSCSHDCAYCPNEPIVKLSLKIERIDDNCKFVSLITKEDYVLWLNLAKKNIKFYGLDRSLTQWRKSNNSLSSSTYQKLLDGFKVYNKYMRYNKILSFLYLFRLSFNYLLKK